MDRKLRIKKQIVRIQVFLKDRWRYFNTTMQGVHHAAHFFIAGWFIYFASLLIAHPVWALFLLAFAKELYDILMMEETTKIKWEDHFWDIGSWMFGGLTWIILIGLFG